MTENNSGSPPPPSKPLRPKKRRNWKRLFIRTGAFVLVVAVLLRIVLPLSLPIVLGKVAGIYGLTCDYDRLQLNLFNGDAGMWGLRFKPKEGGDPILATEYCHGNVSVLDLFRGRLVVWRVEADGVDVNLNRNEDGHIPLLDRFVSATASGAKPPVTVAPAARTSAAKSGDIDLASPLRLDALRLNHIRVHIHDKGIKPEVDTELAMDLRLSDLGALNQRTKFEMNLSADPMLDSMQITGDGQSGGKNLDANIHVIVRGIRLKPAAGYLAPLGIRPVGNSITLTAEGRVHTAAAPGNSAGFTGSIAFDQLSARVDEKEAVALDQLRIDADRIDSKSVHLARIILDGARAAGGRGEDGKIQVLGVEYDPSLIAKTPITIKKTSPSTGVGPASPILATIAQEPWSVGELALRNGRIDIHDEAVSPPVMLSLVADELSAKAIVHDPENLNTATNLLGLLHAPGMVRDIKLTGTVLPFAVEKNLKAELLATGIKPDAVKPYLNQIGIESTLSDGQLTAAVETSLTVGDKITAAVKVPRFDFRDAGPLLSMAGVNVSNATADPKTGRIVVDDIELSGPGILVVRDSSGRFGALGFRTMKQSSRGGSEVRPGTRSTAEHHDAQQDSSVGVDAKAIPAATQTSISLDSLPKITLKKFDWTNIRLDLEDQAINPPSVISLDDVGLEMADLSTELNAKVPGHFKAWLKSPQLIKSLELNGSLSAAKSTLILKADVIGKGLNAVPLAPYLKPLGVEPVLRDGSVSLNSLTTLVLDQGPVTASVSMDHIRFADGPSLLASVDKIDAGPASLDQGLISLGQIAIRSPHAAASRLGDGSVAAGGLRLLIPTKSDSSSVAVSTVAAPTASPAPAPAVPIALYLSDLSITDAGIDWADHAVQPLVNINAGASVDLKGLMLGRESPPAEIKLTAYIKGSADHANVDGHFSVGPKGQSVDLDISADGLRPGPLASYLPAGIGSSLKDGKFSTNVKAALSRSDPGGLQLACSTGPLDFAEAGADAPLFHMDSAKMIVPRIDLPENALAVEEISVSGVQTHVERTANGELAFLGLLVGVKTTTPAPIPSPGVSKKLAAEPPIAVKAASVTVAAPPDNPTTGPSVKDLLASAHHLLPTVTIDKLDFDVSEIKLTDFSRPDADPLVISNLRLHNVNRIDWLGKDYAAKPPAHMQFECKVSPVVDRVFVDAMLTPFAITRTLQMDFLATGIHGNGLTRLVPEIAAQVDGSGMTDGTMSAHLEAEAKWDSRSPLDFDISHGVDASFTLSRVEHRAMPGGPVLGGVDEVRCDSIRIVPDQPLVDFKVVEITRPIGLVQRDARGISSMGWLYKFPTTQPAATQRAIVSKTVVPQQPTVAPEPTADQSPPKGEVRIDKLLISGLDFRVEDNAVSPAMIVPLNGLDVEVRNISTLAPYQDKPVRFSAIVSADKVKLQKKGSSPPVFEDRDLFSQVTANGEISLYPRLHGWAKSSVNAFDLQSLQGEARALGEDLTNGLYDMSVDLRFDPSGAIAVHSRFVLTDLSLSEPPDGLVYRFLKLPAPLDVCIGAVEGADDSIALPIGVIIPAPDATAKFEIPYVPLGVGFAGGISNVIATAIAGKPMQAVNIGSNLIGLGGPKQPVDLTTTVSFPRGSSVVTGEQSTELAQLLKHLQADPTLTVTLKHQLGSGDVLISQTRANPTREQCATIEVSLRARKTQLLQLRAQVAGQARAQLVASGAQGADGILQQLRAIDRELAATEESLDQMGDLLRPGAEKQADRRTRAAALQIASDRLKELSAALQSAGVASDRIKGVAAQFNPAKEIDGGRVVISVVARK